MTLGWAVIAARAGSEEHAERNLRGAGFRVYLPRMRCVLTGHRRPNGHGETVLRPMLRGYLFAELHPGQWIEPGPGDHWRHWRTPWNNRRAFVSDDAIAVLRQSEAAEGRERVERIERPEIGAAVSADLFGSRIDGIVRELRGADRMLIETMAGRRIEVPASAVLASIDDEPIAPMGKAKGGAARAASLSAERRQEIARNAALSRWRGSAVTG